ncbi:hypothetical protein VTK56DRAFT_6770 [Thermocarpiscus australiensis]
MEPDLYRTRVRKFSCKPPGYDAARQRENQRRHRARVKGRIAELEAALFSAQSRLDGALRRIEDLTAEVQRLQHAADSATPDSTSTSETSTLELAIQSQRAFAVSIPASETGQTQGSSCELDVSLGAEKLPAGPGSCTTCIQAGDVDTTASANFATRSYARPPDAQHASPEALDTLQATGVPTSGFDDPNDDCPLLPPPRVGESTIPCREAHSIILDRSTPEFDLRSAAEYLKPGFRRAIVPGTGCRVQTHVLFSFVDRITST